MSVKWIVSYAIGARNREICIASTKIFTNNLKNLQPTNIQYCYISYCKERMLSQFWFYLDITSIGGHWRHWTRYKRHINGWLQRDSMYVDNDHYETSCGSLYIKISWKPWMIRQIFSVILIQYNILSHNLISKYNAKPGRLRYLTKDLNCFSSYIV